MKQILLEMCLLGVGGSDSIHSDYLEERLTHDQLCDWLAFYKIRPFGSKRDDIRQANATYWTVSASVSEAPPDHCRKKYMLDFGDGPPLNEAEKIMQRIRERMSR